MNTITIEDPKEAIALLKSEIPDIEMPSVWFSHDHQFIASAWNRKADGSLNTSHQAYGSTATEAINALREKIAAHNPKAQLEAEAAALGLKLVPADAA